MLDTCQSCQLPHALACFKARVLQQVDFMISWGTPWLELDASDQMLLLLESIRNMCILEGRKTSKS